MPEIARLRFANRFQFAADLEQEFQEHYYESYRVPLRCVCAFVAAVYLVLLFRGLHQGTPARDLAFDSLPALAFAAILLLSFWRGFKRIWQPCFALFLALILPLVLRDHARAIAGSMLLPTLSSKLDAFFAASFFTLMLLVGIVRLQLLWAAMVQIFFFALCIRYGAAYLHAGVLSVLNIADFLFLIQFILAFNLGVQERLQREAFAANRELARQRAEEQKRREHTETMLHVLSQAIGGIVHDLGNPLTAVQTGAQTLEALLNEESSGGREMEREVLEIITDGARMLDYLRLSLLEQTRVLEDKNVPLVYEHASLQLMIEAAVHYQSPKLIAGRRVILEGEDSEVWADRMRLTTVFMNLIGNALKYSDGEVCVTWRTAQGCILCGVMDQGKDTRGICQADAARLFVAFGRLNSHMAIEGTGLGLVSARMIAEAHGGEIFIEGHQNGTAVSPSFCTAQHSYPALLKPGFLTAFVFVLPCESSLVHD